MSTGWDSLFTRGSKLVPWDCEKSESKCYTLALDWPPEATSVTADLDKRYDIPYQRKAPVMAGPDKYCNMPNPCAEIDCGQPKVGSQPLTDRAFDVNRIIAEIEAFNKRVSLNEQGTGAEAMRRALAGLKPACSTELESPIGPDRFETPTARPTNNKNPFKGKVTVDLDWD